LLTAPCWSHSIVSQELQCELTCPVCLELFRDPVILECGHHFCQVCIIQCWEAKADELSSCPKCRKSCGRKLRPNSLLCNRGGTNTHRENGV
uniref:Zinc-binding protein A33-like n=1 Tax=Gouania willdenowi TaxID=441366 RepID=A0A8C5DZX6_GOUWI